MHEKYKCPQSYLQHGVKLEALLLTLKGSNQGYIFDFRISPKNIVALFLLIIIKMNRVIRLNVFLVYLSVPNNGLVHFLFQDSITSA